MLKPEILDPQGQAVANALPRLGVSDVASVRIGRRIEIEFAGEPRPGPGPRDRRQAARQPGHRGLHGPRVEADETVDAATRDRPGRCGHLPRLARRRGRGPCRADRRRRRRSALWHGDPRAARGGRRRPARRLLLRRLPALRRHRPVRPGDGDDRRRGPGRPAGARHLQRLPDPLRGPPAARRADPQPAPALPQPRPGRCASSRPATAWTNALPARPGDRSSRSRTARAATSPTTATLDELEAEGRVVARYVGGNPNGSQRDIAAITNAAGNVVGIMPHPEHAVEALTGPSLDGLGFFTSVLKHLVGAPA